MEHFVQFEDVSKYYQTGSVRIAAADHLNFYVDKGEFCIIVGPSGAGKTTLLIAHRISTVEGMDKIVFLEDGRVEAVGTHDALYHSCPEYRRMVDLQRLEDETADSSDAVGTFDIADSVDAPEHASESVEKYEGGASHD